MMTEDQERIYIIHEILKMDIRAFRIVGHNDTGIYLHEPAGYYPKLKAVYQQLSTPELKTIFLLRVHYYNLKVNNKIEQKRKQKQHEKQKHFTN
jgi:hypothetical protein